MSVGAAQRILGPTLEVRRRPIRRIGAERRERSHKCRGAIRRAIPRVRFVQMNVGIDQARENDHPAQVYFSHSGLGSNLAGNCDSLNPVVRHHHIA